MMTVMMMKLMRVMTMMPMLTAMTVATAWKLGVFNYRTHAANQRSAPAWKLDFFYDSASSGRVPHVVHNKLRSS